MAHIGLKQLDPILTGSLQVSGSAGVTGSLSVTSNIGALGDISASGNLITNTVQAGNSTLGLTLSGNVTASADISGSSTSTGSFGYLNVHGDGVFGGNLTFGDAATDSVSFGADIDSNLIPNVDDTYDIGSAGQAWKDIYLEGDIIQSDAGVFKTETGNLTVSASSILRLEGKTGVVIDVTDATDGHLILKANKGIDIGMGSAPDIDVPIRMAASSFNLRATSSLVLSGSDMDLNSEGTFDLDAGGAVTIDGSSISLGRASDVPFIIETSTLDIDSSGAITIDGDDSLGISVDTSGSIYAATTMKISGSTGLNIGDDTATLDFDGSGAVSETGMTSVSLTPSSTVDIDAGGAVTIDGSAITIGGDDSGVAVSIGHTTSETTVKDNLTVAGDLSTGNVAVTGSLVMTGNLTANQYIVSSSVTYLTQSFSSGSTVFGDTSDDIHEFTGSLNITGSAIVSGSTLKVNTPLTSSTAIFSNNTQVGYPTSNTWDNGLSGSYFQNFDNTTHISEVLRFMSGILSHSLDVSDAVPNNKYYNSIDTNENSLGSTDSISGYLPTNYTSVSNTTLNYLVHKGWTSVGATVFSGISVYHDNGRTHYVDFDSNSAGSSQASSSVDSELFGLGSLSSGNANTFGIRIVATQSFSDVSTNSSPDESSNKFTTQSYYDETLTSFGTTNGVELAKINTVNPAVIPAAYQDGKFENVGGTSTMSGSLSRKWHATSGSITSVSSSGYYKFHDLAVGIKSGSQSVYTFKSGTDKNRFWAPIDQIDSDIGTNSLADTGTTHKALTATSRSLSGVPYLIDATYEVSTKITGLFNPMYPSSTTLVDMSSTSVGVGSVSISGDTISTNGGTVQTSGKLFQSDGTTAVDSGVPRYDDIAIVTASVTYDSGTSENINQTGLGDSSFQVRTKARNRDSSQSTLNTQTIKYHLAGNFGQPADSGSLGIYGRAQGYDSNTLQDTTETFTGEDFRIVLADNVQAFNGTAWTTTYQLTGGSNQIGDYDLQVKPGYLVDPGGDYRYWYPASFGSGTYKYYVRRFQTDGSTYSSMTVNLNNNTLIAWNATTNGVSCAILFESSGNGSGNNASLGVARIYDPVKTTSNLIEADISADNFKNPFSTAISLYGNSGGSISSNTYTVPIRNADGMYLDSNDNELYVIVRYKGDPTPIDDITLTFS